jgi:hypothetical protein
MKDRKYSVYLLYHEGSVVYVGMSCNLNQRLKTHLESLKVFDEVKYYNTPCKSSAQNLEVYLIDKIHPDLNIAQGTKIKISKGKDIFDKGLTLLNFEGFDNHKSSCKKLGVKDRGIYATYENTSTTDDTIVLRVRAPNIGIVEVDGHFYKLVEVVNIFSSYEDIKDSRQLTDKKVSSANGFICKPLKDCGDWDFKTSEGLFYLSRSTK